MAKRFDLLLIGHANLYERLEEIEKQIKKEMDGYLNALFTTHKKDFSIDGAIDNILALF